MPQYQGVWTLEQQAQAQSNQQWVTDPNFKNTTLLLQADGVSGAAQNNTFLDSSSNSFGITRNGNTTQGSFSPFSQAPGYWGVNFNNPAASSEGYTYTSFLNGTSSAANLFGATAWTIEAWVYPIRRTGGLTANEQLPIIQWFSSVTTRWGIGLVLSSGIFVPTMYHDDGGSTPSLVGSTSKPVPINAWTHIAVSLSGGTYRIFVNGELSASTSSYTYPYNVAAFWIGKVRYDAFGNVDLGGFDGYISNLRVVNGTAVYTSTFTPQTTPLTPITNTALLTCQSNRVVDNSTNNTSITVNGATTIQGFGPFAPALQWTPDVVGGSGYFDGSDDLSVSQAAGNFGTSNFSIECFYRNSAAYSGTVYPRIVSKSIVTANTSGAWGLGTRNGTTDEVNFSYNTGSGFTTIGTSFNVNDFAWHHLLATWDGTRIRVFVDGVLRANSTATISSFGTATGDPVRIGYQSRDNNYINGYVSGLRIVNGSIPTSYQTASTTNGTAIFTPPTAPQTTSSQGATAANVSLLLNYTNAGIYDGKMAMNLETVSTAQVATAPVKYGSGSMKFNGTSDYLVSFNNVPMGTGDCTIEAWVYPTYTGSGVYAILTTGPGGTANNLRFGVNASKLYLDILGAAVFSGTGPNVPTNVWVHMAITRANGVWYGFINGILMGSTTTQGTASITGTERYIGLLGPTGAAGNTPGGWWNGYIDDLRVTQGIARYIANFTPPQQALPRQ